LDATELEDNLQTYKYSGNYDDPLLAELYDQSETTIDDVELIRKLIGESGPLNILEPFSGTGRILVPLARDGHEVTGIELAPSMSARAMDKVARLGPNAMERVTLKVQDVLDGQWGSGYDLVVIGANAFCELPAAEMQELCITLAWEALAPGGWLFVDNNDYKDDWGEGPFGQKRVIFEGMGIDGTYGRAMMTPLGFDEEQRVLHIRRTWFTRTPDGTQHTVEYLGHKHPVSAKDVETWLGRHGFEILQVFGDRQGNPYTEKSDRAIFWVRRPR
jgi:predicted O-methyltransferase YrrM